MRNPDTQDTAHRGRWLVGCCALALVVGCSSTTNPLPPPLQGSAVDNPVSCKDLQSGQIVAKQIHLDGGVPNCAADGLRCPLPGVSASTSASVCGTKIVVAQCQQNSWTLACEAAPDGSAPQEAGTADGGDAAADAAGAADGGGDAAADAAVDAGTD